MKTSEGWPVALSIAGMAENIKRSTSDKERFIQAVDKRDKGTYRRC
jgi:hypothetical protein